MGRKGRRGKNSRCRNFRREKRSMQSRMRKEKERHPQFKIDFIFKCLLLSVVVCCLPFSFSCCCSYLKWVKHTQRNNPLETLQMTWNEERLVSSCLSFPFSPQKTTLINKDPGDDRIMPLLKLISHILIISSSLPLRLSASFSMSFRSGWGIWQRSKTCR
jgi:hypothetical protein